MSKEFYENLNLFLRNEEDNLEDENDEYNVNMDDVELDEAFDRVAPLLDEHNEKLDLSKYYN